MVIYASSSSRWAAVKSRDSQADRAFVYCVKTTQIFCRPTCKARLARRANVVFHDNAIEAEAHGFRACKRCRPEMPSHDPHAEVAKKACATIYDLAVQGREASLAELARGAGLTESHFHRVFKSVMGLTPKRYSKSLQPGFRARSESSTALSDVHTPMEVLQGPITQGFILPDLGQRCDVDFLNSSMGEQSPELVKSIDFIIQSWALSFVLVAVFDNTVCALETGETYADLFRHLQHRFPETDLRPVEWPKPLMTPHDHLFESVMLALERPTGRMLNVSPTALFPAGAMA